MKREQGGKGNWRRLNDIFLSYDGLGAVLLASSPPPPLGAGFFFFLVWSIFHFSPSTFPPSYLIFLSILDTMVRHKKENFSRNKKFTTPRPKPRGDAETGASARPPYRAACWDLGHCDPKRCSGKRLMQFGLMRELSIGQRFPGVIVSYVRPSHFHLTPLTVLVQMRRKSYPPPIANC